MCRSDSHLTSRSVSRSSVRDAVRGGALTPREGEAKVAPQKAVPSPSFAPRRSRSAGGFLYSVSPLDGCGHGAPLPWRLFVARRENEFWSQSRRPLEAEICR